MTGLPPIDWTRVSLTDCTKGAVVILLIAVAGYSFFKNQNEFGLAMLGNALYVGGAAADGLTLKGAVSKSLAVQSMIVHDTQNIRNSPAQGGTPLSLSETVERSAVVTPPPPGDLPLI